MLRQATPAFDRIAPCQRPAGTLNRLLPSSEQPLRMYHTFGSHGRCQPEGFPLLRIMRNAVRVKSFHSFAQRVGLIVGLFQQGDHILILLCRELCPTYGVQLLLKLRDLAFQRACLALKGGHSALAAGHGFLEGRFQLLHAAVHGVDLTLQTGCLIRHTTDVHLRCSCFRRRRAAAVGIL